MSWTSLNITWLKFCGSTIITEEHNEQAAIIGRWSDRSFKKQYRKGQIERDTDCIDRGIADNLYHVDLLTAITDVLNIWHGLDGSTIYNCWLKTGLVEDRMNSEQVTLNHVGEIGSIVFNSILEDEDNCFDQAV